MLAMLRIVALRVMNRLCSLKFKLSISCDINYGASTGLSLFVIQLLSFNAELVISKYLY